MKKLLILLFISGSFGLLFADFGVFPVTKKELNSVTNSIAISTTSLKQQLNEISISTGIKKMEYLIVVDETNGSSTAQNYDSPEKYGAFNIDVTTSSIISLKIKAVIGIYYSDIASSGTIKLVGRIRSRRTSTFNDTPPLIVTLTSNPYYVSSSTTPVYFSAEVPIPVTYLSAFSKLSEIIFGVLVRLNKNSNDGSTTYYYRSAPILEVIYVER